MDTYDEFILEYTNKKLLDRLGILSQHNSGYLPLEDQGKQLFGDGKNPDYSQAFYELNLECLRNWARVYGAYPKMDKY